MRAWVLPWVRRRDVGGGRGRQEEKIHALLNSPTTGQIAVLEKTEGMKYLLAMMSKGRDVSQFMADVVKNVVVKAVELKKVRTPLTLPSLCVPSFVGVAVSRCCPWM